MIKTLLIRLKVIIRPCPVPLLLHKRKRGKRTHKHCLNPENYICFSSVMSPFNVIMTWKHMELKAKLVTFAIAIYNPVKQDQQNTKCFQNSSSWHSPPKQNHLSKLHAHQSWQRLKQEIVYSTKTYWTETVFEWWKTNLWQYKAYIET